MVRLDRDAGRTGEGVLHFFPSTALQKGGERCGHYRMLDLGYLVSVNDRPVAVADET